MGKTKLESRYFIDYDNQEFSNAMVMWGETSLEMTKEIKNKHTQFTNYLTLEQKSTGDNKVEPLLIENKDQAILAGFSLLYWAKEEWPTNLFNHIDKILGDERVDDLVNNFVDGMTELIKEKK